MSVTSSPIHRSSAEPGRCGLQRNVRTPYVPDLPPHGLPIQRSPAAPNSHSRGVRHSGTSVLRASRTYHHTDCRSNEVRQHRTPTAGEYGTPRHPYSVRPGLTTTRTADPTKSGTPGHPYSVRPGLLISRTVRSREVISAEVLADLPPLFDAAPPASAGMPTRTARRQPEPGVQVQLRLDGHQLHWLDAQVTRLHAPSRTALVLALLRVHLGAPR